MIAEAWSEARKKGVPPHAMLLVVDIRKQSMSVVINGVETCSYPVSTAKAGVGEQIDSFRTPRGLHRVCERIGEGLPPGSILKSRVFTGEVLPPEQWRQGSTASDLILSRILRLEGCEQGMNRGGSVDSFARMIYIHGTNQEQYVGHEPASHGCIRMGNADVIALFDLASGHDAWVYIF